MGYKPQAKLYLKQHKAAGFDWQNQRIPKFENCALFQEEVAFMEIGLALFLFFIAITLHS
jgi:hypothetical protein